jgi:hypothetical protein
MVLFGHQPVCASYEIVFNSTVELALIRNVLSTIQSHNSKQLTENLFSS